MNVKSAIFCILILLTISLSLGIVCAGENSSSTHLEPLSVEESPIDVESESVEIDNDVSTENEIENEILSSSDDDDVLSVTENEEKEKSFSNEEILTDNEGSFNDLQDIIDKAEAGSTVKLTKNYSYQNGNNRSGILINKNLEIDGDNYVLDGKNEDVHVFHVLNSSLTLKNIRFIDASCAIDAMGINLTMDNCNFSNVNCSVSAISSYFQYAYESIISINNSNFENSKTMNLFFASDIVYGGDVSIYNSNFNNIEGSAVAADTLKLHNSKFINIRGEESSPVSASSAQVSDCEFINNSANPGWRPGHFITYNGGAISVTYYLNVTNSRFINNTARNYGGAIYVRGASGKLNVTNCSFINNYVNESGGAIFVPSYPESNFNIVDSIFIDNHAGQFGGAIFAYHRLNITGSEFVNNDANVGGAICAINFDSIENSIFNENCANFGNNIAINNTKKIDEDGVYYFIHRTEDVLMGNLSDGYKIFFSNYTVLVLNYTSYTGETVFYDKINEPYFYPYFIDESYWNVFINGIYYNADKSKINDYFLSDYVFYYNLNLSEYNFGISDSQQAVYDLYAHINNKIFNEERWNEIKLEKIHELLNDDSINGEIPDHGFFKQIDSTTYAFVDFEILQSVRHWSYAFEKNGVGTYSYWLPAYKLSYLDISEIANFTVQKISLNKTVNVGEVTSFDIIVKNTGLIDLTEIFVSELIPDGLTYISHSNDDVWIKNDNIFNYIKTLGVNETVKFTIDFNTTLIGNFTNAVIAGSNETENKTANNVTEVINETDIPENETDVPDNETDIPENETDVPDNETDIPENETDVPSNETEETSDIEENVIEYPPAEDDEVSFDDYARGPEPVNKTSSIYEEMKSEPEASKEKSENVKVDKNATGNPIFLILLVLLTALTTLRRRD